MVVLSGISIIEVSYIKKDNTMWKSVTATLGTMSMIMEILTIIMLGIGIYVLGRYDNYGKILKV